MGGVSEEQAAEAAAQQSEEAGHGHCEDDDKEATVEGDLDDTVGDTGIETDVMEGGESQEVGCVLFMIVIGRTIIMILILLQC